MQIRLTVLVPRGGRSAARPCDVLITAPPGTPLAAVTDALATTAAAASADPPADDSGSETAPPGGPSAQPTTSGRSGRTGLPGHDPVPVYDGSERLDPQRQLLGEPPLIEGAVLSLHAPSPTPVSAYGPARARLHVTAGPDAGGVHLLHGGDVSIGRSAEADVPLDDPDVSRLHCLVRVAEGPAAGDGSVSVSDRGSRNGTSVDGLPVGDQPTPFPPGATLRLGESAVRLEASPSTAGPPPALDTAPDGQGQLRLTGTTADANRAVSARPVDPMTGAGGAGVTAAGVVGTTATATTPGTAASPAAEAPERERELAGSPSTPSRFPAEATTRGTGTAVPPGAPAADSTSETAPRRRIGRGIGAWARRLAPGRDLPDAGTGTADTSAESGWDSRPEQGRAGPREGSRPAGGAARDQVAYDPREPGDASGESTARWPDPATVLLTALGPGPKLWERGPGHPDALTVRLGSAHRRGGPGDPVTIDLRAAGSLGLAGPRARLARMARSLLAQLAALHAPGSLEIVLLATDRTRELSSRTAEWSWLGWLPHLRPGHGQDCRLLTAYDDEQATARTEELLRRLDEGLPPSGTNAPSTTNAPAEQTSASGSGQPCRSGADTTGSGPGSAAAPESRTLLVVDGDPGSVELREALARIAAEGPTAGIHVMCLAETPSASPASPLDATLQAAYAASPPFRRCHTLALLSGAVATAVRLIAHDPVTAGRSAGSGPVHGTVATVDGVSAAWAERFARALAPLREAEGTAGATPPSRRAASALPRDCRLLEELGLARATPAAVLNRWDTTARSGAPPADSVVPPVVAHLVLGIGPRGTVESDLAATGVHALVTGPSGSGRTELLRALAASLAAGERPDRLELVLVDGAGTTRDGGLQSTAELPHVNSSLSTGDPVRMREFAQSLSAELKRRTELLGDLTYEQHLRAYGSNHHRVVAPRAPAERQSGRVAAASRPGREDPEHHDPPGTRGPGVLPRLVVLVDDFDRLVDPALGDPGRPAAGSVVRALESVAAGGAALGVHLITTSGRPERTAHSRADQESGIRIELTGVDGQDAAPGRGSVLFPDGSRVPVQAGRVTGRIPRTATVRPTVVPLDWERAGDPPTRRPVRELGNGPTDLALLASAMTRATRSLSSPSGGADPSGGTGAPDAVRPADPAGEGVEGARDRPAGNTSGHRAVCGSGGQPKRS